MILPSQNLCLENMPIFRLLPVLAFSFVLFSASLSAHALEANINKERDVIMPPKVPGFTLNYDNVLWALELNETYKRGVQASYDFKSTEFGRPYLSAGLNYRLEKENDFKTFSDNAALSIQSRDISFEAGGGLHIPLDEDVSLTGKYRFTDKRDINFEAADLDYAAHEIRLGLSFKFSPHPAK